jgi:hypothetical protein
VKVGARAAVLAASCCVASACGTVASSPRPSPAERADVARRFAEAIFRGNAPAAVALLVHSDDKALTSFVARAAAPWRAQHGSIRLPGSRSGARWTFGYVGTHAHANGTFVQIRGDIAVTVGGSRGAAGVELFMIRKDHVRFATHHDSVLLPSNR